MQIRQYQIDAIDQLRAKFLAGLKRILLVMPTGSGKTVTFTHLLSLALKRGSSAVVLTDRIELMQQSAKTLGNSNIGFSILHGNSKFEKTKICVSMIETFAIRAKKDSNLLNFDIFVLDEAHKGCFAKLLEVIPKNAYVIGATATPLSLSKKYTLTDFWEDIVCPVGIKDLISQNFLCDAETYSHNKIISNLQIKCGEYTEESQYKALNPLYEDVAKAYKQLLNGQPALCFNINIKHSIEVCQFFNNVGIKSKHIDSTMPKDVQDSIFSDFFNRKFDVLHSVGKITTGFDAPMVMGVIINRKTKSLPLYLQMCGRGSRIFENKQKFIIVDIGRNYEEFGLWQDERNWASLWKEEKKTRKSSIAPRKMCPQCNMILFLQIKTCPNCGLDFLDKPKEAVRIGELESVASTIAQKIILLFPDADFFNICREIAIRAKDYKEYTYNINELIHIKGYKRGFFWVNREKFQKIWKAVRYIRLRHD